MRRAVVVLFVPLLLAGLVACSGDDGEDPQAFCRQLTPQVRNVDQALADSVAGTDPAGGRRRLEAALAELDRMAKVAPGEVDGDVKVVAKALREYRDALADADPDDPVATREALETIQGNRDDIEQASKHLREYAADKCGVRLGTTSTPSTTTTTAAG